MGSGALVWSLLLARLIDSKLICIISSSLNSKRQTKQAWAHGSAGQSRESR